MVNIKKPKIGEYKEYIKICYIDLENIINKHFNMKYNLAYHLDLSNNGYREVDVNPIEELNLNELSSGSMYANNFLDKLCSDGIIDKGEYLIVAD